MFDHILVTTDGSALGNLALPIAADLARKYGGSLTLLYVVPTPSPPPILSGGVAYMYVHTLPAESARLQREGQLILAEARKLLDVPGVQALCTEARGLNVPQTVAAEVRRVGAGLVVMGTHGRSGIAHLFLGSVAEAVLRGVDVPVLLIRPPGGEAEDTPKTPEGMGAAGLPDGPPPS